MDVRKIKSENYYELLAETEEFAEETYAAIRKARRSPTLLKLQWLAQRVQKANRIKEMIEAGEYKVSSDKVATALLAF